MIFKKKFKKSLRWRWVVLLWISIMIIYTIITIPLTFYLKEQKLQQSVQYANTQNTQLMSFLAKEQFDTLQQYHAFFEDENNAKRQLILSRLYGNPIDIRLYDTNDSLIYESKVLSTNSLLKDNGHLQEVIVDDKKGIIILNPLQSESNQTIGYLQVVYSLSDYQQYVKRLYKDVVTLTLLIAVVFLIVVNILTYYIFKPIKHMNDIMTSIKSEADTKQRMVLSHKRYGELTELSDGFNVLLDTMERYITQQKQFVEDVSHELRTPVAIVEGHLKLLNRWGKDDPKVLEESLGAALSEIERMKTLVQEMLDLSRAEQVDIQYKNEITEVVTLVEQVHQNFQLIYEQFTFTLDLDMPVKEDIFVNISRHHLEQVLIILLDNAVKYSTTKPYIHLSVSKTVSNVQISVQDFGEGISQVDLPKVFGRFYRVDKARSRHKGGNGLGLSIAKELIEGYGGSIQVESVINDGSTFRIVLPIMLDKTKIVQAKRKQER